MKTMILLTALSMAFGWRIRGQFGHEAGAAIAGALGAMAIVLLSGREDWRRRVHYFALLGAMGWSFGGSISYMKVIGYSHSSDSATVLYGFAGVFLIGFLWAGLGGAGTALAAVLEEDQLREVVRAIAVVCGAWLVQDTVLDLLRLSPNWFDSDWIGATVAAAAAVALAVWRGRWFDFGSSLVLHLAVGWWAAFGLLVVALGWHLNPPRGDNWAGVLGLFGGWVVFARRRGLTEAWRAAWWCGILGATGFCAGQALKLTLIATGAEWGWHATMEWFHGLFFGAALAVSMAPLLGFRAVCRGAAPAARWLGTFAVFFVVWLIPYLNFRRTPSAWLRHVKTLPESVYGLALSAGFLPSRGWIGWVELAFAAFGAILVALLARQQARPLALIPESWQGRGQLLYLTLLWFLFFISTAHEAPMLNGMVLVMQLGVGVTGLACMWLLLSAEPAAVGTAVWPRRAVVIALIAATGASFGGWAVKRALFGDTFSGYFYMDHIRFGPANTNDKR